MIRDTIENQHNCILIKSATNRIRLNKRNFPAKGHC